MLHDTWQCDERQSDFHLPILSASNSTHYKGTVLPITVLLYCCSQISKLWRTVCSPPYIFYVKNIWTLPARFQNFKPGQWIDSTCRILRLHFLFLGRTPDLQPLLHCSSLHHCLIFGSYRVLVYHCCCAPIPSQSCTPCRFCHVCCH